MDPMTLFAGANTALSLGSLLGLGGSSGGSNTETRKPAARDDKQDFLYDDWFIQTFGYDPAADTEDFLKANPTIEAQIMDRVTKELANNPNGGLNLRELNDSEWWVDGDVVAVLDSDGKVINYVPRDEVGLTAPDNVNFAASDRLRTQYAKEAMANQEHQPSLLDRMKEDYDFGKDSAIKEGAGVYRAGNKLLDENLATNQALGLLKDKYVSDNQSIIDAVSGTAQSKPMNIKFGDFSMPFTTGTQAASRNRFGQLTDKNYAAEQGQLGLDKEHSKLNYGLVTDFLSRLNDINSKYTPNAAELAYHQYMTPIVEKMEGNRYGVPSTTTTGNYDPGFNYTGAKDLLEQLDTLMKINNQNNTTTGGGGSTGGGGGAGTNQSFANLMY
ncbi:hypothetical protein [Pseudoalteromonas sp.]|uniref:hypothetical protein n=1 Tax=Pseudoalteromonas sp. TaxID=53249 RepID=UPI0026366760|nr:hypothetical protein [Pseudoalteromonas sp.]MCP4585322.1 hypothetical protein [Pseudoalteromonas sp.]